MKPQPYDVEGQPIRTWLGNQPVTLPGQIYLALHTEDPDPDDAVHFDVDAPGRYSRASKPNTEGVKASVPPELSDSSAQSNWCGCPGPCYEHRRILLCNLDGWRGRLACWFGYHVWALRHDGRLMNPRCQRTHCGKWMAWASPTYGSRVHDRQWRRGVWSE